MATTHTSREAYNETFIRELERLNAAQRRAVEHIDGPVMVIAGPGTGKTHLLGARIGRILLNTDARSNNILCLTFTDAGVQAMRQRLLRLIGPEAHRVHIYTFHSFCNGVIQDNLEYFGRQDLEPLSELERIELVRRLIDDLDVHHPLKASHRGPYFYETQLYDLFQRMKAENWRVEYVQQQIDAYVVDLPNRPEFTYQVNRGKIRAGDPKTAQIEKQGERMERLRAAAALYPRYQAYMRELGRYDYEDMILWVIEAFRNNESLLRSYQEQYLYILVDEYQDTNGAQNEILRLLTSYWDNPNLFIVGDDDQSIYEFQGARLRNLVDFYQRYATSLEVVLLQDNYRSTQHILDAARLLIDRNVRRITRHLQHLGVEKVLSAHHPDYGAGQLRPVVVEYPNRVQEIAGVLRQLEAWHEAGIAWRDMAVIYARHRQARRLAQLLEKRGIPYQTKRRLNVLDTPLVRQLRELLMYLQREQRRPYQGEHLLFRLLHYRCFEIVPADLAQLSMTRAQFPPDRQWPWRDYLRRPGSWPEGLEQPRRIQETAAWLEEMIGLVGTLPVPALVERALNRSGLLRQALESPERVLQVQIVKSFFDFVRSEGDRYPRLTLEQLLDTLDRMDDNRLALPLQRQFALDDAVTLVTAHSAKGLEFRCVLMLDCTTDFWEPGRGNAFHRFTFPDTLTLSGEEDELEARRRLFYVAMTRAQEHLQISYGRQDDRGKGLQRSRFIDEVLEGEQLEVQERTLPPEELLEIEILQMQEQAPPEVPVLEREVVSRLLDNFQLSVSAFHRYLRCPVGFFYEVVLQAPQLQSEAASYGIALHNGLQRLFDRMLLDDDRRFADAAELVRLFEREMEQLRGFFSEREYRRRLEQGRRNLAAYYRSHISTWPRRVRTEARVRHAEVDGVPLTGVIDRIDFIDDTDVEIIDYKTGSQNDAKLRPPTDARPHGGSYWRQLVFYKLLFENQPGQTRRAVRGKIAYLDPDGRGAFPEKELMFEPAQVQTLRQLISETYRKIMDQDFYRGCGEPECAWCRFLRQDLEVDSFSERSVEELDDI